MPTESATTATQQPAAAVATPAAGSGVSPAEASLLARLHANEAARRAADRSDVEILAELERLGTFCRLGYRSSASAVADLLGVDRFEPHRRVLAAEAVQPSVTVTGEVLPARLPATAAVFGSGEISLRHVETIAALLDSPAGRRLDPSTAAEAEVQLARHAVHATPGEVKKWGTQLVEALDQDGAEPDHTPAVETNELRISRFRGRSGGRIVGHYDSAVLFDQIATVVDALSAPRDADDQRSAPERQAEGLAEACAQVLAVGALPETGGRRPHLVVTIGLDDLQDRARSATLEFGGQISPHAVRQLACDAGIIPVVLDSRSVPLDIGRASRTIPDGIRRAVTARDGGCAHPGCDRPPSWCEVHHVLEWQHGGPTAVGNLVMLCRHHHRLVHHSGWEIRMINAMPEFVPPAWIDPQRIPRRRPSTPPRRRPPLPPRPVLRDVA